MSKSNAQRQREYRERHLMSLDDEYELLERINLMVSCSAKKGLKRLAGHAGITQKMMLEKVISEAENRVVETLSSRQQSDYYDRYCVTYGKE